MRAVLNIACDELALVFRDRGSLVIMCLALVIYSFFYPTPYLNEVLRDVPIAVVDLDHSQTSRKLVRMIDAADSTAVTDQTDDLPQARDKLLKRQVHGIVLIPSDFERQIQRKEPVSVVLYADGSYFLSNRAVQSAVQTVATTLGAQLEVARLHGGGIPIEEATAMRAPVNQVATALGNPGSGYASYVVPAVLVLIIQQTLLIGIGLLYGTERERLYVFSGQRSHKAGVVATVVGKALAYLLLYLVISAYYFVLLPRIYGFKSIPDIASLLPFVVTYLLACIFFGLALANFFRQRETSAIVLAFTSLPFAFLSGFSWPHEAMPGWLTTLAAMIPSTPGIEGSLLINQLGASLYEVRYQWLNLCALVLIYFPFACLAEMRLARNRAQEPAQKPPAAVQDKN